MKKYNVIVVFNKNLSKTLMCKRAKEPYKGMFNLVGGKIERNRICFIGRKSARGCSFNEGCTI